MIIFAGSATATIRSKSSVAPSDHQIMRYGLQRDSGGAGRHRGGLGIEREYHFLQPAFITFTSSGRRRRRGGSGAGRKAP
jgi:N-methylhydantoinase B/oxoprolinase/acetone carboxylase alpha subunit